jgi:two-component system, NtrC family, nitrogen regulation sensor histidine kinase NtrY
MRWPGRFALKMLGQMLLVALVAALLSTYAFYDVALRFADFSVAQADRVAVASKRAAEVFRSYFDDRKEQFRRRAAAIAHSGVQDLDELAGTEGLLRARLVDGPQEIDSWEADSATLARSREAPPIVVALPTLPGDDTPRVLELTFGIPLEMYENSLLLREAIDKEKELGQVYEHVIPRFLRQYIVLVLMMLAAAPLIGWVFARQVTRRVGRLHEAALRVGAGDLGVRVAAKGKDELAQLGRAFDAMVAELAHARSRLEYLQKVSAWQEVARRLAHEIKNPLTPVQLAVQELASKYAGDDPAYRRLLETATEILREEIGGLRRLVEDFSAFAKLPEVDPAAIDLNLLVTEILRLQPEWQAFVTVEPGLGPVPAMCDRTLFRRVIANLVENAVQAAQGVGRTPAIRIRVEARGRRAAVTVSDNGPGVPEADRQRIFDPYVTHRAGGTGLGLAIVRKIVIDHGGDVSVASTPSGGAAFTVELPAGRPVAGPSETGPGPEQKG